MSEYVDIVMNEAPGPESSFVEAEDDQGQSVNVGEWLPPHSENNSGPFWRLRIQWDTIGGLNE